MAAKLKLEELANLCSFILHAHAMQGRSSRKRSCCPVIWNSVLQGLIIHTFSWGQHRLSGHINVSALEKSLSLVLLIQVGSPVPNQRHSLWSSSPSPFYHKAASSTPSWSLGSREWTRVQAYEVFHLLSTALVYCLFCGDGESSGFQGQKWLLHHFVRCSR